MSERNPNAEQHEKEVVNKMAKCTRVEEEEHKKQLAPAVAETKLEKRVKLDARAKLSKKERQKLQTAAKARVERELANFIAKQEQQLAGSDEPADILYSIKRQERAAQEERKAEKAKKMK